MVSWLSTAVFLLSSFSSLFASDCGIRKVDFDDSVVGVKNVSKDDFLWTVALENVEHTGNTQFCGAAVLTDRWVVTAAHCVNQLSNVSTIRGVFGTKNIDEKPYFVTHFEESVIHPSHNYLTFENDIALLKTKEVIPGFSDTIRGICLPRKESDVSGRAVVSGWGQFTQDGDLSGQMKALPVNVFHSSDCKSLYHSLFKKSQMLCAGYIKGKYDACYGNAGGPLETMINGRVHLIGIASFGKGCALALYPGVYTKVSHYVNWIEQVLGPDFKQTQEYNTECPTHCLNINAEKSNAN